MIIVRQHAEAAGDSKVMDALGLPAVFLSGAGYSNANSGMKDFEKSVERKAGGKKRAPLPNSTWGR